MSEEAAVAEFSDGTKDLGDKIVALTSSKLNHWLTISSRSTESSQPVVPS